jgi:hypothetical protein
MRSGFNVFGIPSEFTIGGVFLPPLLPLGLVALAMAVLTSRWLNRVRLSRYLFYPPLVFLSLIVIYMRLVSYAGLFGAFHV